LLVYAPLTVGALLWAWGRDRRLAWTLDAPWMSGAYALRLAVSLGLGLGLALAVVALTPVFVDRARWARALHAELAELIHPLSRSEIMVLALSSGIAEELFFRGAMQPVLGLTLSSAVFGLVHVGPRKVFLAWITWAFVMGLLFGLIFELTGVLWGPVLAHVWINQRNMTYIRRR
jgi:hypothetical protein